MRGIKAVLYVAVLVCLIGSSYAASCNHGKEGSTGLCICQSGYDPVTPSGTPCGDLAAAACVGARLNMTEANHFPSLAINGATTFTNNILHARIEAVYVANRQYDELKFNVDPAHEFTTCALGGTGSYWNQVAYQIGGAGSSCNDSFTLALPWSNHRDCGFANNTMLSDADSMYITGYLHIKYTDDLGEVENFTLTRSTKVPYSITVKFQKHVTVKLLALNVSSDVKFGMALTEDVYDPVSQILTLELTTIVNWPNMFYTGFSSMYLYHPDNVELVPLCSLVGNGAQAYANTNCTGGSPTLTYPEKLDCQSFLVDSICKQSFTWKSQIAAGATNNCTFDGDYNFQISLYTCRPAGGPAAEPSCTHQVLNITYTIQDSNVCGEIGVTPAVNGDLFAFPPTVTSGFRSKVGVEDITSFKLGTYGHFYARIQSDENAISIRFTNIRFKMSGGSTWTDLYAGSELTRSQYLDIYNLKKYFRIYFHSSTFHVQPNSQVVYTFAATCEISFQGNAGYDAATSETKKRTIEMTWTQATASAQTNVFMSAPAAATEQVETSNAGVSSLTFIASVVGAVAGTMIIVFVVVGLALRARSSKDEASVSILAASAAASEIANRA